MGCPRGEGIILDEVVSLGHGQCLRMHSAMSQQQAVLLAAEGMSAMDLEEVSGQNRRASAGSHMHHSDPLVPLLLGFGLASFSGETYKNVSDPGASTDSNNSLLPVLGSPPF